MRGTPAIRPVHPPTTMPSLSPVSRSDSPRRFVPSSSYHSQFTTESQTETAGSQSVHDQPQGNRTTQAQLGNEGGERQVSRNSLVSHTGS
jgi:hypothetical protein